MKSLKMTISILSVFVLFLLSPLAAYAATSPSLGLSNTFAILSSTYTNTSGGTTIHGDLGYTTGPAVAPTVSANTHVVDATYNQAGIDQGTALTALNSQPCTFTFADGAVDLATDTTHGTVRVYTPGVYCITGAASVGTAGIVLNGSGTYIFRMTGALNTVANSPVTLSNGASTCNVWWTPGAATTLGADSIFAGIDIDQYGITIGNNVTWTGNALAFGGTVSTASDTITIATCSTTTTTTTTPGLPDTGAGSQTVNILEWGIPAVVILGSIITYFVIQKKNKSLSGYSHKER
jgi:hypothetical protein